MIAATSGRYEGVAQLPGWAMGPRFGLSGATKAPGSRPQSCHLPRPPQRITPISVKAGIFVEFMGLVECLVHYRPLNTPLSPNPPPRWERCDGDGASGTGDSTGVTRHSLTWLFLAATGSARLGTRRIGLPDVTRGTDGTGAAGKPMLTTRPCPEFGDRFRAITGDNVNLARGGGHSERRVRGSKGWGLLIKQTPSLIKPPRTPKPRNPTSPQPHQPHAPTPPSPAGTR
jgi:hypothetical protein